MNVIAIKAKREKTEERPALSWPVDNMKQLNICIIRDPEGRKERMGSKKDLKKKMAKFISKFDLKPQPTHPRGSTNSTNTQNHETTPGPV